MRAPDFVIGPTGDPYLRRWWVIPRNRWFNIYLHHLVGPDEDRAMHDHPWWNLSIILCGGYIEHMPHARRWRGARSVVFRNAKAAHRLVPCLTGCWSLFITGPVIREWGFHCPNGWVHWRSFVDGRDKGQIGAGCGE